MRLLNSLQNAFSWFFAVSAASLMWLVNAHGKFVIGDALAFKWLYLLCVFCIGLAATFTAIYAATLFLRNLIYDIIFDRLDQIPSKLQVSKEENDGGGTYSATRDKVLESGNLFWFAHNSLPILLPVGALGIGLYLLGVALITFYFFLFTITYL